MQKLSIWIITVLCLSGITITNSFASNPLSDYQYCKSINLQGNSKYKAVYLDNEVYKHASGNLSDIRVVDNKNMFVSYYIQDGYSYTTQTDSTYDTNQIRRHKEKSDTVYDFEIIPAYGAQKDIIGNSLQFTVSDEFLKEVIVYGSYDGITWDTLVRDKIYAVDNMTKLNAALNGNYRYKYYRIRILNDIENINLAALKLKFSDTAYINSSYSKAGKLNYEIKNEQKSTLITLKNSDRLKIRKIHLNIDGSFNRQYEVYTKSSNDYTYAGISGNIYNLEFKDLSASDTDIDFGSSPVSSEFIQLKIINLDDRPLDIKSIDTQCYLEKLVFEAKPNTSYRLFFSNSTAEKPVYDMESYKEHIELENQDVCTLSKISPNSVYGSDNADAAVIPDMSKIFNILIVILSIGLIVLLVTKLKLNKNNKT